MTIQAGRVRELFLHPVKSMAATAVDSSWLGWHGLPGDRRYAFRRSTDASGFPWLTASRLPELLLYRPDGRDASSEEPLPTHVRTPEGLRLELRGEELRAELSRRFSSEVELTRIDHGIFDAASVSLIGSGTLLGLEREVEQPMDPRRFRPNIVIEGPALVPFGEDRWVGGTLVLGDDDLGAAVSVTMRDLRCVMINLNPDTATQDPSIMRTLVRLNENHAGVYGTVVREGPLSIGQPVCLRGIR